MMEKYNEKLKNDCEIQRNIVFNAIINTKRKKNTRMIPLFQETNDKTTQEIMAEREELFGEN